MVSSSGDPVDLSAKARKLLFKIRDFEQDGLTGRKMLERLRAEGDQISDRQFWNTRRLARDMREAARKFSRTRKDLPRRDEAIPLAPFRFTRGRVQYHVKLTGKNADGEDVEPEYVTVSSNRSLSRAEVEQNAMNLIQLGGETYGIDLDQGVKINVEEIWRNA